LNGGNQSIEALFQRYINNTCSDEDIKRLLQYFDEGNNEELLKGLIKNQNSESQLTGDYQELLDTTLKKIKQDITIDPEGIPATIIPLYKKLWFRVGVAVILASLISTMLLYVLKPKGEKAIAQNREVKEQPRDVPPGINSAVLTLDNGTSIKLDSTANGTLAQQGNTYVQKMGGQIAYNKKGDDMNAKPVYNTVTTARGNQYQLILSDGSKVWLNAASSIHFPTFFAGNERKVEITGEVYFEVAKDAAKPFKVEFSTSSGQSAQVEVLGTDFDVNAYSDNADTKTTLLEGKVKITRAAQTQMLSPGQQALLSANMIALNKDVDVSQAVAWKDGFFMFNNTDLQTIMKQATRWYNIEVNYEGKMASEGFTGKISRNVPLSEFLKILEMNDLHVKKEGRKITIVS
jgi:transmembrane sensor